MDEFAYCEPPPTKNPHDPRRTPGGIQRAVRRCGRGRTLRSRGRVTDAAVDRGPRGVLRRRRVQAHVRAHGVRRHPPRLLQSIRSASSLLRRRSPPASPRSSRAGSTDVAEAARPRRSRAVGRPFPRGRVGTPTRDTWRCSGTEDFELRPSYRCPGASLWNSKDWGSRVGDLLHAEMALGHAPWVDRFAHLYDLGPRRRPPGRELTPPTSGSGSAGTHGTPSPACSGAAWLGNGVPLAAPARRLAASPRSATGTPGTAR